MQQECSFASDGMEQCSPTFSCFHPVLLSSLETGNKVKTYHPKRKTKNKLDTPLCLEECKLSVCYFHVCLFPFMNTVTSDFCLIFIGFFDAFEKKSTTLELELVNAQKDHNETI